MNIAEYISEYLTFMDVSHVFGMSGANIEDLFKAIHKKNGPTIILAKNEYNASTMAIGSYLSTQKIAVVLTTSGPGVLNTLPVLAEAFTSKIPLVLISGVVPESMEGFGAFQDTSGKGGTFNILEMLKEVSCFQIKIKDENTIPEALEKAFELSHLYKRPAVILIPKDIFSKEMPPFESHRKNSLSNKRTYTELSSAITFCQEFSNSDGMPPLVVLGEELIHLKDRAMINKFILKTASQVALTANSKSIFDNKDSSFLGIIGIMGHSEVSEYLKKSDYLILIGVNFDLLNRYGMQDLISSKKILVIKEEKSLSLFRYSGERVCEIYGDIEENVGRLASSIATSKLATGRIAHPKCITDDTGYNFKNIINTIQMTIEEDANIFVDAGNTGAFIVHHLESSGRGAYYVSLGMGGMGNSIGAGIGSAVASQKKSHVFLGDGSFLMYGLEIHTALEYNLPIVFFIFNNNSHGMCSTRENVFLEGESGINNFKKSRYAEGISKIFPGISSYEVSEISSLKQVLNDILGSRSPCVVSINITNSEDPPFKTFSKN